MYCSCHNIRTSFVLLLLISRVALSEVPATPPDAQATPSKITDLIHQLEHPDYDQRESASHELQVSGRDAIPALLAAAVEQSPEAATRSLHILESLLLTEDKSIFEPVDDGLTELTFSDRGNVVVAASQILARHMLLREERAVAAIRELGGTVQYDAVDSSSNPQQLLMAGPVYRNGSSQIFPQTIILGTKWQGGVDGLKYLRWLSHRDHLVLYVIRGSQVTLADAQSLAANLPNLTVFERGAYLGLMGGRSIEPNVCVVDGVQEGGPAEKAGLHPNDQILKLNDNKVGAFQDLIDQLKDFAVGDRITLTVRRSARTLPVEVVLGEWTMPDYSPNALRILERARQLESQTDDGDSSPSLPLEAIDDSLIEK